MKRYEYIFLFTKNPKFEINNFRINKAIKYKERFGKWISNLFYMPPDYENLHLVKKHRAGFPVALPKMFIDIFSKKNDIILDPFLGLGSTAIAAEELGRRWVGCELIKEYCDITKFRLAHLQTTL